jgi:xylose isomerase
MNGSITSVDAALRRESIALIKRGIDFAKEAEAADVQLWLGQDGYEYPFQVDYQRAWGWLTEALHEVCTHRSDVKITIEYKFWEPRNRCFINTVGKVLAILAEIGAGPHVGCTLDVGHSLMALENPAESAVLLMRQGRLFHLHFNDNYRNWDLDMIPGSVNVWDTLELFYWLEKMNFDGWHGIDIYPYREDGSTALQETVNAMRHYRRLARELLERGKIEVLQAKSDVMAIQRMLRTEVLR